jgi:hypothetical protein
MDTYAAADTDMIRFMWYLLQVVDDDRSVRVYNLEDDVHARIVGDIVSALHAHTHVQTACMPAILDTIYSLIRDECIDEIVHNYVGVTLAGLTI